MSFYCVRVAGVLAVLILSMSSCVAQKVDFAYETGMFAELPHERGELLFDTFHEQLPVTTGDSTAEQFFQQGMLQLYTGDRFEAARAFREVITRDPDCAMGYWGIAVCVEDLSLQTEYMWYASKRRGNVETDVERLLIDTYNELLGTATEPEMVVVESETGKRRARPVEHDTMFDDRWSQFKKSLKQHVDQNPETPEILPLLLQYQTGSSLASVLLNTAPDHPMVPRLAHSMRLPEQVLEQAFIPNQWDKEWNALGIAFLKEDDSGKACLAFEAACRADNAWLRRHDGVPYERQPGYVSNQLDLIEATSSASLKEQMVNAQKMLPQHPGVSNVASSFRSSKDIGKPEASSSVTEDQRNFVKALGPLVWTPSTVPEFKLPRGKADGTLGSKDFKSPTIVVFYLGFGCIHCVEQLNELRPRYLDFKDAGIEIVTIGVDPVDRVRAAILDSIEVDGPKTPFEILCDTEGDVFKQFHCWDEFTDEPLHGTFLIDRQGRILWRDISEEPFMQTDFLLKESTRLISLWDKQ